MENWIPDLKTEKSWLGVQMMQESQTQHSMDMARKRRFAEIDEDARERGAKMPRYLSEKKAGSQEQKTGSQEQKAGSQEQRSEACIHTNRDKQRKLRFSLYLPWLKPDNAIEIYTKPQLKRAKEPRLKADNGIQLTGMILKVKINGYEASLFVDSGTDANYMSVSSLNKFQFKTEIKWKKIQITTVEGRSACLAARIGEQEIKLENGRTLVDDIILTDSLSEDIFDDCDGYFGAKSLIKFGCLQKFKKDGTSTMYLRDQIYHVGSDNEFGIKGYFTGIKNGRPLNILVDTGATETILSKALMKKIEDNSDAAETSSKPKKVVLVNQDGIHFELPDLEVHESPSADVSLGLNFLYKYEALVDYHMRLIYLTTRGKTFKTSLYDLSHLFNN